MSRFCRSLSAFRDCYLPCVTLVVRVSAAWRPGRVISGGCQASRDETPLHTNAKIVGLISDTHGLLRDEALAALHGSRPDCAHPGIGKAEILTALEKLALIVVIRGNSDTEPWARTLPETAVAGRRDDRWYPQLPDFRSGPVCAGLHRYQRHAGYKMLPSARRTSLFVRRLAAPCRELDTLAQCRWTAGSCCQVRLSTCCSADAAALMPVSHSAGWTALIRLALRRRMSHGVKLRAAGGTVTGRRLGIWDDAVR